MLGTDYTRDELLAIAPGARSVPQIVGQDGELIGDYTALQGYFGGKAFEG